MVGHLLPHKRRKSSRCINRKGKEDDFLYVSICQQPEWSFFFCDEQGRFAIHERFKKCCKMKNRKELTQVEGCPTLKISNSFYTSFLCLPLLNVNLTKKKNRKELTQVEG